MIVNITAPDSGTILLFGRHIDSNLQNHIGYLPEERGVYRKMKVGAFLTYMAQLKGLSAEDAEARVPKLLESMALPGTDNKRCEDLSKGMLQRVQFIAAIIHQPDLLILDEPFSGQDPVSVRLLRERIVQEHRRGATVLLSTHVMANAEEMCQHVVMIHEGRKVLDESMIGLRRQFDTRTIHFEPLDANADPSPLQAVPGVERLDRHGDSFTITLSDGVDPAGDIGRLAMAVAPARVELARLRLEDVFISIVAEGATGGDAARALRASLLAPGAEGALV
jgi:ABC-2 type transport system ATP-binding protein